VTRERKGSEHTAWTPYHATVVVRECPGNRGKLKPPSPPGTRHPEKARGLLRQGGGAQPAMSFRFIGAEKATCSVKMLCEMLGV
jgi:hypothetical protein